VAIAKEAGRAASKQVLPPETKETGAKESTGEQIELLSGLHHRTQATEGLEESNRRLEIAREKAAATETPAYSAPQPRKAMPVTALLHSDDEWEIAIQCIDKLGYLITYDDQLKTFAVPGLAEDQAAIVFHPDREKATQARLAAIWRETAAPSVELEKGPDDLRVDRELKQARDLAALQAASKASGR
jgi:hypothetical protein